MGSSNKYQLNSKMSVNRRELVEYFEENGFRLLCEGKKHSIYTNEEKNDTDQKAPLARSNHCQPVV